MKDYLSAIEIFDKENYADKEKLGAVGTRFGASSVLCWIEFYEKKFKVFVSHAGVFNNEIDYLETEELWFNNWDWEGALWNLKKGEKFGNYAHFPNLYIDKWNIPILIIHGEKDYRFFIPKE